MSVELAVSASQKTPGVALKVNLLAGPPSPGTAALKVLLLAVKSSSGTITPDTQLVRALAGPDAVKTYFGPGTPAHLFAKKAYKESGLMQMDAIAMTVSGGVVATKDLVFAGTVTTAYTVTISVCGRTWGMTWAAGVTPTTFTALVRDQINARTLDLPASATASSGTLSVSAKFAGSWGNDIIVKIVLADGAGGTIDGGATSTQNLATGTLSADPTTALGLVTTTEYHLIALIDGNTGAAISGSTSPYYKVNTHIATYNQAGMQVLLQQQVVGFTGTVSAGNTAAGLRNTGTAELLTYQAAQGLPAEVQGCEVGARMRELALDPKKNRIKMPYIDPPYGPIDDVGDKLTAVEIEGALSAGNCPIDFTPSGVAFPVRPCTTYTLDTSNNLDSRLFDVSRVDGTYVVARDLVVYASQTWTGKSIINDLAASQELPRNCVEVKTIKSGITNRCRFWAGAGAVLRSDDLEASIANGELVVERNASDASQVDCVVPVTTIPPLAKIGIVVNHVAA